MSSRVTRSAARLAADSSTATAQTPTSEPTQPPPSSRKRKAPSLSEPSPPNAPEPVRVTPARRTKRQRVEELDLTPSISTTTAPQSYRKREKPATTMSAPGYVRIRYSRKNTANMYIDPPQSYPLKPLHHLPRHRPRQGGSRAVIRKLGKVIVSSVRQVGNTYYF